MAFQNKTSLLILLVAVFMFCEIYQEASAATRRFRTTRFRYSSGRTRRKECADKEGKHERCLKIKKELGDQVCHTDMLQLRSKLERSCAKTCQFCGAEPENCRVSKFGCCWDGATPSQDVYGITGCPECKDHAGTLCERFQRFCGLTDKKVRLSSTSLYIRLHCPITCRRCKEKARYPAKGKLVSSDDWRNL